MTVNVFGLKLLPESARKANMIRKACLTTLSSEGVAVEGELNVVFVDRKRMLELNKKFLDHTHDTDVIAFEYKKEASPDGQSPSGDQPFGDIYISASQARAQAKEVGHSVLNEALTLAIHGTLHLIGYTDATSRQKAAMFRKQDSLLVQIKKR
jgi:probable rRNA maturation factor